MKIFNDEGVNKFVECVAIGIMVYGAVGYIFEIGVIKDFVNQAVLGMAYIAAAALIGLIISTLFDWVRLLAEKILTKK